MTERGPRVLVAVTTAALLVVIGTGAALGSTAIGDDLEDSAGQALRAEGLGAVEVEATGREVELSEGSTSELAAALRVVERLDGVRSASVDADDVTGVATLALERERGGLRISGAVPDAASAARLKAAASNAFGVTVLGDLTVDDALPDVDWTTELPSAFGEMTGVKDLDLDVEGDTLEIDGTLESQAAVESTDQLVATALPSLTVRSEIEVDAGGLSAADARTLGESTLYFDAGSASLSDDADDRLDALAEVLRRNPGLRVEAGGHAGPEDPERGQQLADERASAARDRLVDAGVSADRVATKSYGSDLQAVDDPAARQYRRVEFIVKEMR